MTTNEALVERVARAMWEEQAEQIALNNVMTWERLERRYKDMAKGLASAAIAALTPPAAEGEVTQAAFTEGLWAGWRSGLAGEQMDDDYAARSWLASDANSHLAHAAPKDVLEIELPQNMRELPERYKLVPVEPTEAMLEAGDCARPVFCDRIWSAMITAAPSPLSKDEGRG